MPGRAKWLMEVVSIRWTSIRMRLPLAKKNIKRKGTVTDGNQCIERMLKECEFLGNVVEKCEKAARGEGYNKKVVGNHEANFRAAFRGNPTGYVKFTAVMVIVT
jgi:hypothetical protein